MNDKEKVGAERKKRLLQLLTAAAVCFMACRLFIQPLWLQLDEQQRQREELEQRLRGYREFAVAHEDYAAFEQRQKKQLAALQRRLPERTELSMLLPLWQRQARECAVKISGLKALEPQKSESKIYVQPIRITMDGNYYGVLKFVHLLEKGENFVNLTRVEISGDENKGEIKLSAVLNIYGYRKDGDILP